MDSISEMFEEESIDFLALALEVEAAM